MKQIFIHNDNFYILYKDQYEPDELYFLRVKYIKENLNTKPYDQLVIESLKISNMKLHKCTYFPEFNFSLT